MKLNLGCCDDHRVGYVNVDIAPPADQIVDLRGPWPWPDSSVEEVLARDVFEHLPDRIHTMNELWRVLRPGGRAFIEVPSALSAGQFQDPTHCSDWVRNSFQYFCLDKHNAAPSFAHRRFSQRSGNRALFRRISIDQRDYQDDYEVVTKITAVLEAVK